MMVYQHMVRRYQSVYTDLGQDRHRGQHVTTNLDKFMYHDCKIVYGESLMNQIDLWY